MASSSNDRRLNVIVVGSIKGRTEAEPPSAEAGLSPLLELTDMHARGHLTDEELSAAKRKLVGLE